MTLKQLTAGMLIPYGGDRATTVPPDLAAAFAPGDALLIVQETGDLLHIEAAVRHQAAQAVSRAAAAFTALAAVPDSAISAFFDAFAARLADDALWAPIAAANARDVAAAREAGRAVTRLQATPKMRADMVAGLRAWRDTPPSRGQVLARIDHPGWSIDQIAAPLGVVGFVFEGRPNVVADAAGVLRGGNTAVLRIGSDALATAQALMHGAVAPALSEAGLPAGALALVDSAERAAGWALFSDRRLALAVARGSGQAVAQLGSVARQSGVPVSLHGTGGAWLVAAADAETERFSAAIRHSLDRKVCNTLNVCCIARTRAADLVPAFLDALSEAGAARGAGCRLHVVQGSEACVPEDWRTRQISAGRTPGSCAAAVVSVLPQDDLAREWEWDDTPEVSLVLVDDVAEAAALFNRYSPRFVVSLISASADAHRQFFDRVEAPFVGDGFTRWVDGQYALNKPELGLSNWEHGRLLARGGILSGDGVTTIRSRMRQTDTTLRR
jgi:glutamate-5-semialdehyde dehydrogenase